MITGRKLSAKAAAPPPALQALLAAKARPFDDESEVDDSDGGESEGQGFALPDWPAYRRKTVSEAPRREDPSVAADALRRENIRRRWRLAKNRIMQKECIDPLAPPLALYEPATLDKFDRAGGPPEALTGGLCGRPASLPPAPVDGALPPREPREAIGELPKYILNRPDADAPANRPPATRRTLVYTYADGAVAAPPEDAPEPGGATAAYVFESRFESGNLLHAAVVERDYGGAEPSPSGEPYPDAEFDCAMCPDVGTGGHTQWFYFRVDGLRKGVRYRFNVTNFAKADSLYLEGMQPLVYGVGAAKSGVGWRRAGKVVCYSKNTAEAHRQQVADMRRASGLAIDGGDDGEESSGSGSASDGESDGGGDGAAPDGDGAKPESKPPSLPSSDNDNNGTDTPREPTPREQRKKKEAEKPNAWRKEEKRRQRGRRGTHTLSFDLTLDDDEPSLYLAYSHPYTYTDLQAEGESRQRRLVVLSSRVHPGESNASWVMQGILDFLTSDDARAVALRRHFVFKICPMLNPDGVIQSNYRCSNSGMDLNRQWSAPSREAHPPVAALKHLIRARAKGVFLYGILSDADRYGLRARRSLAKDARESASAAREMTEKATKKPFDAAAVAAAKEAVAAAYGMFTKKKTTFRLGRGKAGTARAVVCRELGVRRSYTLEVSFMGGVAGRHRDAQFTTRDLLDLGGQWCAALVDFFGLDDEVAAMAKAARAAAAASAGAGARADRGRAAGRRRGAGAGKRDPRSGRRGPSPRRRRTSPPASASGSPRNRRPEEGRRRRGRRARAGAGARKPAAARPKLGRRASGADLEPRKLALKARLGRAQSTIVKRPNRPAAGGPGLRRSTSTSQRGRKPGAKADEARPPARSSLGDSAASSSEAPAPPKSAPEALGASLVASPGRRGGAGVAAPGPTLDVDDRVLAEEIRDQPAPRVSFNMSRPGSRASLNFPVVPAAANAPPAEGAAPALPERRPEPPPDSRPSSNDADHRKHRTLSDEKSASESATELGVMLAGLLPSGGVVGLCVSAGGSGGGAAMPGRGRSEGTGLGSPMDASARLTEPVDDPSS
ncbi:hypothetical protein JL721_4901 [Aureococcus anophagefferens]|nr:hypothetical protein JL721_4901 [Aureococcus anophagefferens]